MTAWDWTGGLGVGRAKLSKTINKIRENTPGKYFVRDTCIGCTLCSAIAPDMFHSNIREGYDFVFKQPSTAEEERLCEEAMDICPVNAITLSFLNA